MFLFWFLWLLEVADVWKFWRTQIRHDTSLALILYFLLPPFLLSSVLPPLLPPSTVSFTGAVRKLLTLLHTCKPECVKAFHKFFFSLKKQKCPAACQMGFWKHTHTNVKSSKSRQLWDLNLTFSPPLFTVWENMFFWQPHGGGKVRKIKKAERKSWRVSNKWGRSGHPPRKRRFFSEGSEPEMSKRTFWFFFKYSNNKKIKQHVCTY